jgi:hypothetical protein
MRYATYCSEGRVTMVHFTMPPEVRVNKALSKLPYGVTKPVRDLMVDLVKDTEMECAIASLIDACKASLMASSMVRAYSRIEGAGPSTS